MSSEESSEYDNFLATQQTREDCPEPPDAATIGCFNSKVSGSPPGLSKRSRKLRKHKKRNNAARQLFYDHSSNPESSAQQSNEEAALAYIKAKAADTLSKCRKELLKAVPELLENFVFPEDIMKAVRFIFAVS